MAPYLDLTLDKNTYAGVLGGFHFGNVKETGRIDTYTLIHTYRRYLQENNWMRLEKFKHEEIVFGEGFVGYQDLEAKNIVFAEGFGIKQNPYFDHLPLEEAKGESIIIHAPELDIDFLLKSTLFVLPLGNKQYKVGATFNSTDKTSEPSLEGKEELVEKLKKVIEVPFTIISQTAGIRPTVKDRKPMIGVHPEHSRLAVLNGLGTRGVMIGPSVAKNLFHHIESGQEIVPETDIKRFSK